MIQQDQSTKSKAFAISSILKNPKLAKIIYESFLAPVGSTKNDKARAILRSLNKTSSNFDGQGGPALNYSPYQNKSPSMSYGTTTPRQAYAPQLVPGVSQGVQPTPPPTEPEPVAPPQPTRFVKSIDHLIPTAQAAELPAQPTQQPMGTISPREAYAPHLIPGKSEWKPGTPISVPTTPTPAPLVPGEEVGMTVTGFPEEEEKLSGLSDTLRKAYESGIGAKAFRLEVMNDPGKMAEVLGVPLEVAKSWPGALVSTAINDLRSTAKDEVGLEQKEQKLNELQTRGITIESDLTAYIRGKDKYLNKLDKMEENAIRRMAKMDLSHPTDRNRANNYLNYLTILKGRRNARYIDFLKAGIAYHDADLKRAEDSYKDAENRVKEIMAEEKPIIEETFKNLSNILEDMYDNIDKRDKLQRTIDDYERKVANSERKMIADLKKNIDVRAELPDVGVPQELRELYPTLSEKELREVWEEIRAKEKEPYPKLRNLAEKFLAEDNKKEAAKIVPKTKSGQTNFWAEVSWIEAQGEKEVDVGIWKDEFGT